MVDPAQMERYFGMMGAIKYTLVEVTLAATTPTPASSTPLDADRGVLLQAHPGNADYIRVGGVGTNSTHGLLMAAGDYLWIATDQPQDVVLWSATAGNKMNGIVL